MAVVLATIAAVFAVYLWWRFVDWLARDGEPRPSRRVRARRPAPEVPLDDAPPEVLDHVYRQVFGSRNPPPTSV